MAALVDAISSDAFRERLAAMGGYDLDLHRRAALLAALRAASAASSGVAHCTAPGRSQER